MEEIILSLEIKNNYFGLALFKENIFIISRDFIDTMSLEITKSLIFKFNVTLCVTTLNIPLEKYDLIIEMGIEVKILNCPIKKIKYFRENLNLSLRALAQLDSYLDMNYENYTILNRNIREVFEKEDGQMTSKIGFLGDYDIYLLKEENFMYLSASAIVSLNLFSFESHPNKFIKTQSNNCLFNKLNFCVTKAGRNLLKEFMFFPLINLKEIERRKKIIEFILKNQLIEEIRLLLKNTCYLPESFSNEYLSSLKRNNEVFKRISNMLKHIYPLEEVAEFSLLNLLSSESSFIFDSSVNIDEDNEDLIINYFPILKELNALKKIYHDLPRYLNEIGKKVFKEYKTEGFIIYFPQIGYLIETKEELNLQLIFKFNSNFYYKNEFMINLDEEIGDITNKINDLELKLCALFVKKTSLYFMKVKNYLSEVDCFQSLANFARENNLVKGEINFNNSFTIKGLKNLFHRNKGYDLALDKSIILTGMNGSGKTTFLKCIANLVILNQIGSFIPCESANIPIFDKVFIKIFNNNTSVFLDELQQISEIIKIGSDKSLIIIDEFGKGTSYFYGVALLLSLLKNFSPKFKIISTHMQEHFFINENGILAIKKEFLFLNQYRFIKTDSINTFGISEGIYLPDSENQLIKSFNFSNAFIELFCSFKNGTNEELLKSMNQNKKEAIKLVNDFIHK
ncbi:hypothetical protein H311_02143 [Anncaliia algerae PRA109]|nr:hypothetical protein H311_02143 [Anncaliia algerae PRA109]